MLMPTVNYPPVVNYGHDAAKSLGLSPDKTLVTINYILSTKVMK